MFAAAAVIAAVVISSCSNAPKASLKTEVDTLSYAIGIAQTQGLKGYIVYQLGVDTTYMDEFLKGVVEGANSVGDEKKNAYLAGVQIGQQVGGQMFDGINRQVFGDDSTQTISKSNLLAGFLTAAAEKEGIFTLDQARTVADEKKRHLTAIRMEKEFAPNRVAGEQFLDSIKGIAEAEGITILPSGLMYKVIKAGKGPVASDSSRVEVNYEGRLIDGTVFETTYKEKDGKVEAKPHKLRVNQVIPGWREALTLMPEGSIWEVYIPQELAYAERNSGKIKPFSALIFKLEVVQANVSKK